MNSTSYLPGRNHLVNHNLRAVPELLYPASNAGRVALQRCVPPRSSGLEPGFSPTALSTARVSSLMSDRVRDTASPGFALEPQFVNRPMALVGCFTLSHFRLRRWKVFKAEAYFMLTDLTDCSHQMDS